MYKDKKIYKILIIEDNSGDFELVKDYLEEQISAPFISHAQNFADARSMLTMKMLNPDAILLDLTLPDKSGAVLIKEITDLCEGCPVIILTGYSDIQFSIKALAMGVADYLLKDSLTAFTLYKSIVYNVERKRTLDKLEESETKYSNLFHMSPQPTWVYDMKSYKFVHVNKAAIELYGYSESEFKDLTIIDISPDENGLRKIKSSYKTGDNEGKFHGKFRHILKSKKEINAEIYSNVITEGENVYRLEIAIDVTENILFENRITRAILKTQEEERREIGSELHDNVCQILASSRMSLGMMAKSLPAKSVKWYEQCKDYISLALNEIRNISHQLAPVLFDDTALEDVFNKLLLSFNLNDQYKIELRIDARVNQYALIRDVQLNLYRILQEQLRNISNYSNATEISVNVNIESENLVMITSDNGIGFDFAQRKDGIGLDNMKRRAELFSGKFEIASEPGKGCKIIITIPLKDVTVKRNSELEFMS